MPAGESDATKGDAVVRESEATTPRANVKESSELRTARLVGWWESDCPVRASHPKVRASLLVGDGGAAALVLASWAGRAVDVAVAVDAAALRRLGVAGANASGALRFEAPEIDGFQPATTWRAGDLVRLQAKGSGWNEGWLAAVVG